MALRYPGGILSARFNPLLAPNAPTDVVAASASATSVVVSFAAPANTGRGPITGYTVVSSGGHVATGTSSPIVVAGLTTGVSYAFVVYANNTFGSSAGSAPSNSAAPVASGQQAYTTPGTYSWTAPAGVTSVCVVCVGGGGYGWARSDGGGGGGGSGGVAGAGGSYYQPNCCSRYPIGGAGGNYGGGAGRGSLYLGACGGSGAVRIVWAGGSRGTPSFPSTNVGA